MGLGLMGSRLSRRLMAAGFHVRGFDVDRGRVEDFVAAGGSAAPSPAEAVQGCWAALLSLPTSKIARQVCLGPDGLTASGVVPLFVYDTTTGSPQDSAELAAALAERGMVYADATLSGNSAMAEQGNLVVMMGGPDDAYARGRPLFDAIGRSHHHVGEAGAGARMKLLVNHVLTVHRVVLAEALVVAELAGMDLGSALGVLKDSLAYSKAMDQWGTRMVAGDHATPLSRLRQGYKDARLIADQALRLGAPVGLIEVVLDVLAEGEARGLADADNSSVVEVLRRRAGIGRVPETP